VKQKGVAIAVIAVLAVVASIVVLAAVYFLIGGGPSGAVGFPSAVGQSLTYGAYLNENKMGSFTLTVTERIQFQGVECFEVELFGQEEIWGALANRFFVDANHKLRYLARTHTEFSFFENKTGTEERTYDYGGNKIRVKMTWDNGGIVENEFDMPTNFSSLYQIIFFWGTELYTGYSKQFNFIQWISYPNNYTDVDLETATIEVIREESLTVPAGTFSCYVVEYSEPGEEGAATFWVDKEKPTLIQYELSPPWSTTVQKMQLENCSEL